MRALTRAPPVAAILYAIVSHLLPQNIAFCCFMLYLLIMIYQVHFNGYGDYFDSVGAMNDTMTTCFQEQFGLTLQD